MEFLRIHDLKTKRLYFLWQTTPTGKPYKCGCIGGCSFYSVFDKNFSPPTNGYFLTDDDYFFNLKKSITRANTNFGRSLFVSAKHILDSHPIMMDKYSIEYYNYKLNSFNDSNLIYYSKDDVSTDSSHLSYKRFNDEKILNPPKLNTIKRKSSLSGSTQTLSKDMGTLKRINSKLAKNKTTQSEISLNRQKSLNRHSADNFSNRLQVQQSTKQSVSTNSNSSLSLFSSSGTTTLNDDDYFTAESSEDTDTPVNNTTRSKYVKNSKKRLSKAISSVSNCSDVSRASSNKQKPSRFSCQSLRSKNSFVSIVEHADLPRVPSKESLLTTTLVEDNLDETNTECNVNENNNNNNNNMMFDQFPTDVDSEMTLKFDIQRPILGN